MVQSSTWARMVLLFEASSAAVILAREFRALRGFAVCALLAISDVTRRQSVIERIHISWAEASDSSHDASSTHHTIDRTASILRREAAEPQRDARKSTERLSSIRTLSCTLGNISIRRIEYSLTNERGSRFGIPLFGHIPPLFQKSRKQRIGAFFRNAADYG